MYLLTGGSGMVGTNIKRNDLLRPSRREMDITDVGSIERYIHSLKKINIKMNGTDGTDGMNGMNEINEMNGTNEIDGIIHLASLNLRDSELNPGLAIQTNIQGTLNMLEIARKRDIPFVFVSTGAVFSDNNGVRVFSKNELKNPKCIYGQTKDCAEQIVSGYSKTILIRTGWLFGGGQKFIDKAIWNIRNDKKMNACNDFYGSFTYVKDFIHRMFNLLENKSYGIHHVVNSGFSTAYDFCCFLCGLLRKPSNQITGISSLSFYGKNHRGKSEMLLSEEPMRHFEEAAAELIMETKPFIRKICRLCKSKKLSIFFNLNPTPLANHFNHVCQYEHEIPLDIAICQDCKHIQLMQIIDPKIQYLNYPYFTAVSKIMTEHIYKTMDELVTKYKISKDENILEIGANDGTCVRYLLEKGFRNTIGVDPALNMKTQDLPIIQNFFGSEFSINKKFRLIYSFHTCAHIEDIESVFQKVKEYLYPDGIFMFEVGYFFEIYQKKTFDVIYHEHIDYHTCYSIFNYCRLFGLNLFRAEVDQHIQGGSIRFYITKDELSYCHAKDFGQMDRLIEQEKMMYSNLQNWKNSILQNGEDIVSILNGFRKMGKKICGYGASAKLTTFFYQYKLNKNLISYIIDDNPQKQGLKTPGYNIDIYSIEHLNEEPVDYIVIFAWNIYSEILEKIRSFLKYNHRVIVPHPSIQFY